MCRNLAQPSCIFAIAKSIWNSMTTIEDILRIAVNAHDGRKDMVV